MMKDKGMTDAFSNEIRAYEDGINNNIIAMLKTGYPGTIQINSNGTDYLFIDCYLTGHDGDYVFLRTKDGKERTFLISDIYSCECHMNRKDDFE